jgi:hypothetical protein
MDSSSADFGVGIVIETITDGKEHDVAVKDIIAHGSADRDGTVEKGDRILMIGDLDAHELVNSAGADTGTVFRKHLKGPSGSHVSLQIRKPSGKVLSVLLVRGNAGYWALYDQLHKANLDLVSLRRELADAHVAAEKATSMLQVARAEKAGAEEQAIKESRARTDLENRCKLLTSQFDNMAKELQARAPVLLS